MIPFNELCAALDRYAARARGEAPPTGDGYAPSASQDSSPLDLPPAPMQPIYEVNSGELEVGEGELDQELP